MRSSRMAHSGSPPTGSSGVSGRSGRRGRLRLRAPQLLNLAAIIEFGALRVRADLLNGATWAESERRLLARAAAASADVEAASVCAHLAAVHGHCCGCSSRWVRLSPPMRLGVLVAATAGGQRTLCLQDCGGALLDDGRGGPPHHVLLQGCRESMLVVVRQVMPQPQVELDHHGGELQKTFGSFSTADVYKVMAMQDATQMYNATESPTLSSVNPLGSSLIVYAIRRVHRR
ncbi:uncharacterized protein [Triticum aestivum]|uniref:uncharacterized protein isoform X1 n=1 Tax=Triticum aestivum TaxID=4565 RepID=UPI001D00D082|nr:uncharacterized protein LOC123157462 isoform X1 [Triticum aestivum]